MRESKEDRELRRLKRRELLEMLLVQCEETERLQKETDQMRAQMAVIMESYERLKKKLDVKDERLNQKDAEIAQLNLEIEELKTAERSGPGEADSVTEAAHRLNEVIEEVRKAVEQFMTDSQKTPFEAGRAPSARRKRSAACIGQVVPMFGQASRPDRSAAAGER